MTQATHQKLLQNDDAFATSLVAILIDDFGTEALAWSPLTIRLELETIYRVVPSHSSFDRLMAGIHLLTNNSFYTQLPDFNDLCNVLAWEPMVPGVFIPADAAACAWGITEAMLLSPPGGENQDDPFSEDIRAFMGAILKNEGILNPPDVLRIAKYDKNIDSKVRYDFSDDPQMFAGIYDAEASKTNEINQFVQIRLRAMIDQLGSLKLQNGNVEEIAEKMMKVLPNPNQGGSPLP